MMTEVTPESKAASQAKLGLPPERLPRSVAVIMDGNGRWARARGLPRSAGHAAGAEAVRTIVTEAVRLDLEALTLYSFSLDNWQRPAEEVSALMHLYALYLARDRPTMAEHNIRFRHVGRRDGLPEAVLREIDASTRTTAECTGMYLCLALNYGSRAEITDAVAHLARRVADGHLRPEDIDEGLISEALGTRGVPDPDLLIRTSGELRLSNFLLWQLSYAELHVTDVYGPDFTIDDLHEALRNYAARDRRFGGLREPKA